MDSENASQSRRRDVASWPTEVSLFLLEFFLQIHAIGSAGDDGLKREHWLRVSKQIYERFGSNYDWEQCRNHFRIWKSRLRALSDLQKQSELGWNPSEKRFDAAPCFWTEVKKKEQKYWKDHSVRPVHLKVAAALGNEIATGTEAETAGDYLNDSQLNSPEAYEFNIQLDENEIGNSSCNLRLIHLTCRVPNLYPHGSSRSRGRPRGDDQSENSNKKKKGVDKVVASLENLSVALIDMVKHCHEKATEKAATEKAAAEKAKDKDELAAAEKAKDKDKLAAAEKAKDKDELLCDAINAVTELDLGTRLRAKDLFGNHNRLANALLSEKEEDRATVIKFFLDKYGTVE